MRMRFRQGAPRVAAATLFALLAVLLLAGFVHTDDGCLVELHCQACRFALSPTDGAPVVPAAPLFPAPAETIDPTDEQAPARLAGLSLAARGPPRA